MAFYLARGKVFPTFPQQEHEVIYVLPGVYIGENFCDVGIDDAVKWSWDPAGWHQEGMWGEEIEFPNPNTSEGQPIKVPVRNFKLSPEQLNALNAARRVGWKETVLEQAESLNPAPSA